MSFLNETKYLTLDHIFSGFGPFAERGQAEPCLSPELANFRKTLLQHPRLGYDHFIYCYFDEMAWSFLYQVREQDNFRLKPSHLTELSDRFRKRVQAEANITTDALEKDIEAVSANLTELVNKQLLKTQKDRFTNILDLSLCLFSVKEKELINLPSFPDGDFSQRTTLALRFLYKLQDSKQLKKYVWINELTRCLAPLSAEDAAGLLAIHLITHYQFHSDALTYTYSEDMEYTRRQFFGLQGAVKKIEKAVAAIDSVAKDGHATEDDAIKDLDEISAKYAKDLKMTPTSSNTEEKLS